MMRINLLPEPSPGQQLRRWILLGLAVALVLANVFLVVTWAGANLQLRQQESLLAETERKIRRLQPAYEEQNRLASLSQQSQVLTEWAASRPALRADLRLLASLLPRQSFITRVELLDEATFSVRAMLPDMASVATYLRVTEEHPEIARVQVLGVQREKQWFQLELQMTMNRNG
jgi:hypothetical protein